MDTTTAAGAVGAMGAGALIFLILSIVITGLIVGALARLVLPGPDPMSWPRTFLYGIGGSLLGGVVGGLLHVQSRLVAIVLSVAGAAVLIWFFRRRNKPAG